MQKEKPDLPWIRKPKPAEKREEPRPSMIVNTIVVAAFMLLPYNLDYLTLMAAIASWLAWKVEEGRNFKRITAEAVGNV
jgi:hypothetical protein